MGKYDWLPYVPFLDEHQKGIQARIAEGRRAARQMPRDPGMLDDFPELMPIPEIAKRGELREFWWKNGPKQKTRVRPVARRAAASVRHGQPGKFFHILLNFLCAP